MLKQLYVKVKCKPSMIFDLQILGSGWKGMPVAVSLTEPGNPFLESTTDPGYTFLKILVN